MNARRPSGGAVVALALYAGFAAATEPPAVPARTNRVSGVKELRAGVDAYRKADYEAARAAFERAAGDARVDPALVKYDLATALLQLDQATNAVPLLRDALNTTNLQVQARAQHNLGQARAAGAEAQAAQQKFKEAVEAIGEAVTAYERALTLAPDALNTKKNYELARRREEELKKLLEEQKQQQQDQQQQPPQDQPKPDQQQPQDQPKPDQGQPDKPQDQPQDSGQTDQPKPQDQPQDAANKPEPSDAQPAEDKPGEGEPVEAGELTREEAQRLLDAMKEEEAGARERMRLNLGRPVPVDKDW